MPEDNPLSQNIQNYHKAIESEFALTPLDDDASLARTKLLSLLTTATRSLEAILINGDTDTVRLSAVKLVFEHTLGKPGSLTADNDLQRIIGSLIPSAPAPAPPST